MALRREDVEASIAEAVVVVHAVPVGTNARPPTVATPEDRGEVHAGRIGSTNFSPLTYTSRLSGANRRFLFTASDRAGVD